MEKTYISALMVVLLAGAQITHAQDSLDDAFAQLDAASDSESVATQSSAEMSGPASEEEIPGNVEYSEPAEVVASVGAEGMSEIDMLYSKGRAYYRSGDYDQAELAFESMLAIDPYDSRAMRYLKRTAQRVASKESRKLRSNRAKAMAEVDSSWNQDEVVKIATGESAVSGVKNEDQQAIDALTERLKGLVIPKLNFRDANIQDVVLFLTETCRRLDPEGKGVNILLVGMDSVSDVGVAGESNITIAIRDMNLLEALSYITEMAELKFEVAPRVVRIMPITYVPKGDLVTKSYDVIPEVGMEMENMSSDSGGGIDDLFGESEPASKGGPIDVTKFFSIVDFPEGTSAVYQPRFKKLFVKNTKRNLKALEDVLSNIEDEAIGKRSQQVNIRAKFVEFNEGALDELGFDWTVFGSGEVADFSLKNLNGVGGFRPGQGYANNSGVVAGGTLYDTPVSGARAVNGNGQNLFGLSQRSNQTAFEAAQSGILKKMGGLPAQMLLGVDEKFDVRITAMEQDGTADVLSAPEVTTKSGNEAVIRVVEVHRYPMDFDVETGQRTAPIVRPQDWEEKDLGVVLRVTPVVDAEANTIDLDLEPQITSFKGYDQYLAAYNSYGGSSQNSEAVIGNGAPLFVEMPYFETRQVQTQVTVSDGSTVAMGGLVNETTETFVDRVPIIGDLPLVGRFFRTEGSRSSKKNLMIFVTATQVDDRGMTREERESRKTIESTN